jgi:hypothetical protein
VTIVTDTGPAGDVPFVVAEQAGPAPVHETVDLEAAKSFLHDAVAGGTVAPVLEPLPLQPQMHAISESVPNAPVLVEVNSMLDHPVVESIYPTLDSAPTAPPLHALLEAATRSPSIPDADSDDDIEFQTEAVMVDETQVAYVNREDSQQQWLAATLKRVRDGVTYRVRR